MNIDFSKIKLVIWDLDDTFWEGTLSEGGAQPLKRNIALVRGLTDRGIINSICSKNDEVCVEVELKAMGCDDLFVFKSIDWTPKGQRIATLIKEMGLQPKHCLFIDDNPINLNEAQHYSSDLIVAEPSIINELIKYVESIPVSDPEHKRLANYKVLEQKQQAKASASDNMAFLYGSDTRVNIKHDCLAHLERISELVTRTNQLNYTKVRSTRDELEQLCKDTSVDVGYVEVSDKFGEYGIVGFYAIREHRCLHFLFSCRTIGQGVEQYVYASLNYPTLEVIGEVVNLVTNAPSPAWINQVHDDVLETDVVTKKMHNKVILKGGCDLNAMSEYLQTDNVITEFTYISPTKHNLIENHNHSTNYLQWHFLSSAEKQRILDECMFGDESMFATSVYEADVSLIFVSTMEEANLGIYRRRCDGFEIAFGEYIYPLTDPKNWELYTNQKIFTAHNNFTFEWLKQFSDEYEFIGCLSPSQILAHAKQFLNKVNNHAKVCYILGSEIPFEKNTQKNYEGRHLIYKEINQLFRTYAANDNKMLLIDINEFLHGQQDFTNNINHFHRRVYYEMATKANEYIEASLKTKLQQKGKFYLFRKDLIDRIGYTGFYQTKLWKYLSKPYTYFKIKKWQH